jgi:hypothetical protein
MVMIPYSAGNVKKCFLMEKNLQFHVRRNMTATKVEVISHNLNLEKIWKKGHIGPSLRKSHDQC